MAGERADLLFEFPESVFYAETAEVKADDISWGERQVRTEQNETAFAFPDEDKAEFLIESLSPKQVLGENLHNGVFSTNFHGFFCKVRPFCLEKFPEPDLIPFLTGASRPSGLAFRRLRPRNGVAFHSGNDVHRRGMCGVAGLKDTQRVHGRVEAVQQQQSRTECRPRRPDA